MVDLTQIQVYLRIKTTSNECLQYRWLVTKLKFIYKKHKKIEVRTRREATDCLSKNIFPRSGSREGNGTRKKTRFFILIMIFVCSGGLGTVMPLTHYFSDRAYFKVSPSLLSLV